MTGTSSPHYWNRRTLMDNPLRDLFRRDSLVETARLSLFGDAVFAIAITLLALEITVPTGLESSQVASALRDAVATIAAYMLSFAVTGVLWLSQHSLFRLIRVVDRGLLVLYFAFLAVVAALPFPTRLISEYGDTAAATCFYAGSVAVAIAFLCMMYVRILIRPSSASAAANPERVKAAIGRCLAMILVFVSSIPLSFVSPTVATYWWLLAIPARLLFRAASDPTRTAVSKTTA
ncbi:TMEM175 family protein [Streptomyces sp. HGB0020]|uniref:TMEM175 family protein n=1 Tax=Streptomyces sp. HGB0020 TaxID=1078086 RepID=UPI001F1E7EB4|nr:TMEM175 family protein [Streptomyces sp. HGB0020]